MSVGKAVFSASAGVGTTTLQNRQDWCRGRTNIIYLVWLEMIAVSS
jgi:hypothetical protein